MADKEQLSRRALLRYKSATTAFAEGKSARGMIKLLEMGMCLAAVQNKELDYDIIQHAHLAGMIK